MIDHSKIPENPAIDHFVNHSFNVVDRIHHILEQKGLTQRDFAKMLHKNESEISKWMSGMHNFTIKTIASIEVALGETILNISESPVSVQSPQDH